MILLLLDSFFCWFDSNTIFFQAKQDAIEVADAILERFADVVWETWKTRVHTWWSDRTSWSFLCVCVGGYLGIHTPYFTVFRLVSYDFICRNNLCPKSFQMSWKKWLFLKIGSQQTARCRINCLFCLANLTADPWHRKWMMGKEARGRLKMASVEDGEFQCEL